MFMDFAQDFFFRLLLDDCGILSLSLSLSLPESLDSDCDFPNLNPEKNPSLGTGSTAFFLLDLSPVPSFCLCFDIFESVELSARDGEGSPFCLDEGRGLLEDAGVVSGPSGLCDLSALDGFCLLVGGGEIGSSVGSCAFVFSSAAGAADFGTGHIVMVTSHPGSTK